MPSYGVYHTAGMYGQYIFVAPDLDIVAVFTSGYGTNDVDENPQMVCDYILPSVISYNPSDNSEIPLTTIQYAIIISVPIIAITLVLFVRKRR
jgi:hypothetical protein